MTTTFSESEYRRLMMLAQLGEWMVNAIRKDPDPGMEDVLERIFSFARGTPLEELVVFDEAEGGWQASEVFERDAHAFIDQYDDKTFWEELTARLTERDLLERHGERAVRGMRPGERSRAAAAIAKGYAHEFEEAGIDRLRVIRQGR